MRIEKIKLKHTKNMRDMGGIPTADGRAIKHGKLIRSGRLCNLPAKTVDALEAMNIDNIVDMRTNSEIREHTPTLLRGAEYHYIPLVATATEEIIEGKSMAGVMLRESRRAKKDYGSAENYIHEMYKIIVFEPQSQKKIKRIFDLFIAEENCIVFHCNSGKDRTGIMSMLLESVLGVEREIIVEDYMASRRFQRRRRNWQKFGLMISPVRRRFKHLLYAMMRTIPEYIENLMDEIERRYGTVTDYVKSLGVTDEEIQLLKDKYLE